MSKRSLHACWVVLLGLTNMAGVQGSEATDIARIDAAKLDYVVFAVTVTLVKIAALTIGYLVVRLGYTTMMAGVQGKDSVALNFAGAKLAFKGVTPGLGLGLFGVFMMVWALSTQHHFSAEASETVQRVEHRQGDSAVRGSGASAEPKSAATSAPETGHVDKAPGFR